MCSCRNSFLSVLAWRRRSIAVFASVSTRHDLPGVAVGHYAPCLPRNSSVCGLVTSLNESGFARPHAAKAPDMTAARAPSMPALSQIAHPHPQLPSRICHACPHQPALAWDTRLNYHRAPTPSVPLAKEAMPFFARTKRSVTLQSWTRSRPMLPCQALRGSMPSSQAGFATFDSSIISLVCFHAMFSRNHA